MFWEGTPLIDSLMKKMNKFQSQSDKAAAYFFVTSPSESSIELESHWYFFQPELMFVGTGGSEKNFLFLPKAVAVAQIEIQTARHKNTANMTRQ